METSVLQIVFTTEFIQSYLKNQTYLCLNQNILW